jgi:GNAT superfamily N-acetyltransferase
MSDLPPGYRMRLAAVADLETLVAHRREMWRDMGQRDEAALANMAERFRPWVLKHMAAGDYRTWLVEHAGETVAGAAAWVRERHPPVGSQHPQYVYVLNVYTEPAHRRRGLARALLTAIIEWAREAGHDTIDLTTSAEGEPLYASLGFVHVNEMRLLLAAVSVVSEPP